MTFRVSVVVPVYNGERFIAPALASIEAQDVDGLETIVLDDGSSDRSAEIARGHGARVIGTEHCGIAHARNLGVAAAVGELIAFLDADDLWPAGSLRARISYLDRHPDLDFVAGARRDFFDAEDPPPRSLARPVLDEPAAAMSTLVVRRDVFAKIGVFDETLVVGEDLDWIARAQDAGCRGHCLDGVHVLRRFHSRNATLRDALLTRRSMTQVLRASIDRKRAASR